MHFFGKKKLERHLFRKTFHSICEDSHFLAFFLTTLPTFYIALFIHFLIGYCRYHDSLTIISVQLKVVTFSITILLTLIAVLFQLPFPTMYRMSFPCYNPNCLSLISYISLYHNLLSNGR